MAKSGKAVIVDVRPREQYTKGHCEGSVSVPLYQSLDWSSGPVLGKALKWAAYSFNGVS
jgi:rhodanese-related sulfurtransferase